MHITKIIATVGSDFSSEQNIRIAIEDCGVNCFRINLGLLHRPSNAYYNRIKKVKPDMAIMLDLSSTRCRVACDIKTEDFLVIGNEYEIKNCEYGEKPETQIGLFYLKDILDNLEINERIWFDDGQIEMIIRDINKQLNSVQVLCIRHGVNRNLRYMSSCSFSGKEKSYSMLAQSDKEFLTNLYVSRVKPDMICVSFARYPEDVQCVKEFINELWPGNVIKIVCKIQTRSAYNNLEKILELSDGIVIERADLALIEGELETAYIQQKLIKRAKEMGKFVIVATGYLWNYCETRTASIAEIEDVLVAIREQADYIMLARETGRGRYSIETIEFLYNIIQRELLEHMDVSMHFSALDRISSNVERWGNKSCLLYELIKNYINVPKGIVVSADLYQEYNIIRNKAIFPIWKKILNLYLKNYIEEQDISGPFIMRSSANIEGKIEFCCSGIFESYVHNDKDMYFDTIIKVWDFCRKKEVLSYLEKNKMNKGKIKMAVLIQPIQKGRVAGTIHTRDIINGMDTIRIEYMPWKIGAVVDGKEISKQIFLDYYGGIIYETISGDFSDDIILQFCELALKVESILGAAEIEFCESNEQIYVLQVREL